MNQPTQYRGEGKTFRVILRALLTASYGCDAYIICGSLLRAEQLLDQVQKICDHRDAWMHGDSREHPLRLRIFGRTITGCTAETLPIVLADPGTMCYYDD